MVGEHMTKDEALDLALEALEGATPKYTRQRKDQKTLGGALDYWKLEQHHRLRAITAIKQARSAPYVASPRVQEPVAKPKLIGWRTADFLNETTDIHSAKNWEVHYEVLPIFEGDPNTKLATPPAAQRQWVGLTDEEIDDLAEFHRLDFMSYDPFTRAILAKIKEKNSG
jgi:hypothetical protein